MISQKTIEEVFEKAQIKDVIEEHIELRRRGVNYIGLCPFHNEKTPSFTVSPTKNIYKCFGCGEAGNPVNFVMTHLGLTYPEAIRSLAGKFGIEIEETADSQENQEARKERDGLYLINDVAKVFFEDQLWKTDYGKSIGLSYFKERGFSEETIRKFGLGFAPNGKDHLTKKLSKDGYSQDVLHKVGLTGNYGQDFFRDRAMFTIFSGTGKVVAFAGRILAQNQKAPKYVNSPETDIYNKSKTLYALNFAKKTIRKEDECLLVEGYTDVIALHQAGIENVVASSGTSLTEGQIHAISRHSQNIKILYDGDAAGVKAALRGLDLILKQDMNVKIVLLPNGEDPDSYLKKVGVDEFREYINTAAKDFILFKTDLLLEETKGDLVKKVGLVKDIVESIALIPDTIKRAVFIRECARLMELEEDILVSEMNKIIHQNFNKKQNYQKSTLSERPAFIPSVSLPKEKPDLENYKERALVNLMIEYGEKTMKDGTTVCAFILSNIMDVIEKFENETYRTIIQEFHRHYQKGKVLESSHFTKHENDKIRKQAIDVLASPYHYSENWDKKFSMPLQTQKMPDENFEREATHTLYRLKLSKVKSLEKEVMEKMQNASEEEILPLLQMQMQIKKMQLELANFFGTVM